MKILLTLIMCFSLSFSAIAGKLEVVKEGQPAPYDGLLADQDQMKEFRQINEEKKLLEEKTEKQEQLSKIKEVETTYYKENLDKTREELDKQEKRTFLTGVAFFLGGVLMTVGVGGLVLLAVP